ncbi:MAG: TolC family protein [Polyangiales bacterium]
MLRRSHRTALVLSLATLVAPHARAAPQEEDVDVSFDLERALIDGERGLTADDAGRRARARAPQLASARASASSARWDQSVQWSAFLPQVQVYAQYKRINLVRNQLFGTFDPAVAMQATAGVDDPEARALFDGLFGGFGNSANFTQPVDSYALGATARVPVSELFLRTFPAHRAARNIADAREIEVEARTASVELSAREAFYAHARAVATRIVAEQALKQAEAQATQARLFVDAGTAAPVDLTTATARVEAMRSSLARTRGAVAITRNTLSTLTGVQTHEAAGIREPVIALPEAPRDDVDALLARALAHRPELRAMRKMVGANDRLSTAERNAALPTLTVDGSALYAQPNPRYVPPVDAFRTSWEVGATLAWTPNSAIIGYQRAQRAAAERERARADLAALEDGVRIEVVQAFEDYKAADAAARSSEAQQHAAEETYRVRLATYRVGAGVQIDLLTSDLALTQARLDRVNAAIDARIALARLRRAIGTKD